METTTKNEEAIEHVQSFKLLHENHRQRRKKC